MCRELPTKNHRSYPISPTGLRLMSKDYLIYFEVIAHSIGIATAGHRMKHAQWRKWPKMWSILIFRHLGPKKSTFLFACSMYAFHLASLGLVPNLVKNAIFEKKWPKNAQKSPKFRDFGPFWVILHQFLKIMIDHYP